MFLATLALGLFLVLALSSGKRARADSLEEGSGGAEGEVQVLPLPGEDLMVGEPVEIGGGFEGLVPTDGMDHGDVPDGPIGAGPEDPGLTHGMAPAEDADIAGQAEWGSGGIGGLTRGDAEASPTAGFCGEPGRPSDSVCHTGFQAHGTCCEGDPGLCWDGKAGSEGFGSPGVISCEGCLSCPLPDPRVFIIHSSSSTVVSNEAAWRVMGLINPSFPGYREDDPSTWAVRFQVKSTRQLEAMSSEEIRSFLEWADIVILHWIGTDHSYLKILNIIRESSAITHDRPGKLFVMLEAGKELAVESRVAGVRVFEGVPDPEVEKILNDLKNADLAKLAGWKNAYPQLATWLDLALYQAAKGIPNYTNMYLYALKRFAELEGGGWQASWRNEWDSRPHQPVPNEMLYRGGRIYLTLEEYLAAYPLDPRRPTAGIVDYTSNLLAGNMGHYEALIDELSARGMNVIPVVGAYSGTLGGRPSNIYSAMVKFFTTAPSAEAFEADPSAYRSRLDVLVSFFFFSLGSGFLEQTARLLEFLNVPVIRAMTTTKRSAGEWLLSDDGLLWSDTYYQIAIPETQGIAEPLLVATTDRTLDPVTGAQLVSFRPVPDRMERLADRVHRWARLRRLANGEKRIAVVYYNYPPGRDNIGASYLDVPGSVFQVLRRLEAEGYALRDLPSSAEGLLDLMLSRGINVSGWAPGVLESLAGEPGVILWDAEEYCAWFSGLHPVARKQVMEGPVGYIEEMVRMGAGQDLSDEATRSALAKTLETWYKEMLSLVEGYPERAGEAKGLLGSMYESLVRVMEGKDVEDSWEAFGRSRAGFQALGLLGLSGWGEPPGDVMTVTRDGRRYIVIPGFILGNVFLGPEPQRGWGEDAGKLYHSTVVPPHHQYLAWYAWVNTRFGADAQVHVGRHATYEWLPRKQVALSEFDYSDLAISDVPSVYIYIVDGVGEGLQAKRRGLAVIVDHLTPPLTTSSLYGGLLQLKSLLEDYQVAESQGNESMMHEYARAIREKVMELHLEADLDLDPGSAQDRELIEAVEGCLKGFLKTLIPYGLHAFGVSWSPEEIVLLATAMVSADGGTSSPSLQRLLAAEMGWDFDDLSLSQAEALNGLALEWVGKLVRGEATVEGLSANPALRGKLAEALEYARRINASFFSELDSLMDALAGGFVSPATGKDPVRNPSALPTGRNFYATSEQLLPTAVAWDLGKKLADTALAQLGSLPEKIAAVVWCVETARDDGVMYSFVLRMLGIEPERTSSWLRGGSVGRMVATPLGTLLSDLNAVRSRLGLDPVNARPRVDVVVTTSGLFRDLFPRMLVNLDRAVRVALASSYHAIMGLYPQLKGSLDHVLSTLVEAKYTNFLGSEPLELNHPARHWVQSVLALMEGGVGAEMAGEMAVVRVFSPPVGDYGAGVNHAVELPWTWDSREQVAELYLTRMGHAYSERLWGLPGQELFRRALEGVGLAYHSRSTNLYGVLDNDDYFDYFGGLSMAVERVNGEAPLLRVLHYANPAGATVTSLGAFLSREMRTRYLNPQGIQGMMQEGYSGARTIANKFVNHLWGWEVTVPGAVGDWMWQEVVDVYIDDRYRLGVREWLSEGNRAYALAELTGTLLTVVHKGFWNPDEATVRKLAELWARTVVERGPSCSAHTCGNRQMFLWAVSYLDGDLARELSRRLEAATGQPLLGEEPGGEEPHGDEPAEPGPGSPEPGDSGETKPPAPPAGPPSGEVPAGEPVPGQEPSPVGQPAPAPRTSRPAQPGRLPGPAPLASLSFPSAPGQERSVGDSRGEEDYPSEAGKEAVRAYEVEEERETGSSAGYAVLVVLGLAAFLLAGLGGYLLAGRRGL
jgi:cobaltochelatase CobN